MKYWDKINLTVMVKIQQDSFKTYLTAHFFEEFDHSICGYSGFK